MSRLRRLATTESIFFITANLLPTRLALGEADFECLAKAINGVRGRRRFLFTGYVFMPDHWHALLAPARGDTLPALMDAVKVAAVRGINARRGTRGSLWQPRYFDEVVWTVGQHHESLRYMHFNPVDAGLVARPEHWPWSSYRCYGGAGEIRLQVDRLQLPTDRDARL